MRSRDPLFVLLLLASIAYAAGWMWNNSYTLDGSRWFTLFDDAMISMRYARSLHDGLGLVWNPGGPRVEGFTNALWVVYMAGLHALPVPPEKLSLLVQATNAALMLGVVTCARRLTLLLTNNSRGAGLCAAALTAFYYSLDFWSWSGLETTAAALLVTAAACGAARPMMSGRAVGRMPFALLSAGTFLRPDLLLPLVILTGYAAWAAPLPDKRRLLVRGLLLAALCAATQTAFRLWYFGVPLPNTYYLKMTGYPPLLRMGRGVWEMGKFTVQGWGLPVLAPFWAVKWGGQAQKARGLLAALWAGQFGYNIYTGGDAWEYWGHASRFVTTAAPLLLCLIACAAQDFFVRRPARFSRLRWAAATGGLLVVMDMLYYPPVAREMATTLVLRPSHAAEDAAPDEDAAFARSAKIIDALTLPTATVAVMRAGITPYFAGRTCYDLLGKCDARIAHEPMHRWRGGGRRTVTDFVPGHMKWDWNYTVNVQKPDVIEGEFSDPDKQAALRGQFVTLRTGNVTLQLRRGSPRIRWERVKESAG